MKVRANRWHRGRAASPRVLGLLLGFVGVAGAVGEAVAQDPPPIPVRSAVPGSGGTGASAGAGGGGIAETRPYPTFRIRREVAIAAVGSAALLGSALTPLAPPDVPRGGFDPANLRWSVDRQAVRSPRAAAMVRSDVMVAAATLLPLAVVASWDSSTPRWERLARTAALHAEVLLVAHGTVLLTKRLVARPRPCTYLPEPIRSGGGHCDVRETRTFQSMPSGHASSAWSGATMALTEQLLNRPHAGWVERAGVGALGGMLATTTSVLRVSAGEHFASDVLLGSGIGILTGVTLPILHRGERPWPSWSAVLQGAGGLVVGSVAGAVVVQLF